MKKLLLISVVLILFFSCEDDDAEVDKIYDYDTLSVMTLNVFFGTEVSDLVLTFDLDSIAKKTDALFEQSIVDNDFGKRSKKIADLIIDNNVDVACLQEIASYYIQEESDYIDSVYAPNADELVISFIDEIISSLSEKGADYKIVNHVVNSDEEFPATKDFASFYDVRMQEGDAIIAKSDLDINSDGNLRYENVFKTDFPPFSGSLDSIILYKSVSYVTMDDIRIANTHLEVFKNEQEAQAQELVNDLSTSQNVILAGDFNSYLGGETNSYLTISSEFTDAFKELYPDGEIETCCQNSSLDNKTNKADHQADHIFYKGNRIRPLEVYLVGDQENDKTEDGKWMSDHFGLVSVFQIRNQ